MDNKNKSYFVKLILVVVIFFSFLTAVGLVAQSVKNKRIVNREPQVSISSEPTATLLVKDETSDWKTYKNDKYGYEVKYPNNWAGIETSPITNYASFTSEKRDMAQAGFWIRVFKNSNKLSIKEWWDKEYIKGDAVYELKGAFLSEGKSEFPVIVFKEKNGLEFNYLVFSKDNYIYIILTPLADEQINQIFSTFKFIEKDEIIGWEAYKSKEYGFELKYPSDIIKISQRNSYTNLSHSIPFKHEDSCDFKGDAPFLKELTDFDINIKIDNLRILNAIKSKEGESISKYIVDNALKTEEGYIEEFKIAQFTGYRIINSFEGCGADNYYLSINDSKTLFIRRKHITEFILNPQRYSSASGVIMPQQAEILFNQIISTFKFIN